MSMWKDVKGSFVTRSRECVVFVGGHQYAVYVECPYDVGYSLVVIYWPMNHPRCQEADPEAREGYMGLFCYLPVAMGSTFEPLGPTWLPVCCVWSTYLKVDKKRKWEHPYGFLHEDLTQFPPKFKRFCKMQDLEALHWRGAHYALEGHVWWFVILSGHRLQGRLSTNCNVFDLIMSRPSCLQRLTTSGGANDHQALWLLTHGLVAASFGGGCQWNGDPMAFKLWFEQATSRTRKIDQWKLYYASELLTSVSNDQGTELTNVFDRVSSMSTGESDTVLFSWWANWIPTAGGGLVGFPSCFCSCSSSKRRLF